MAKYIKRCYIRLAVLSVDTKIVNSLFVAAEAHTSALRTAVFLYVSNKYKSNKNMYNSSSNFTRKT